MRVKNLLGMRFSGRKQTKLRLFILAACTVAFIFYLKNRDEVDTKIQEFKKQGPYGRMFNETFPFLSSFQEIDKFFRWSNPGACTNMTMWGGVLSERRIPWMDGNKTVCLDNNIKPIPRNCIVYSFGINNEWSFDTDAATYGCQVYAFDPTMQIGDHSRGPNGAIHFFETGLSDEDRTRNTSRYRTLGSIMHSLGHAEGIIDFLKIDIEGDEIFSIREMISSGSITNVRQIFVEVHNFEENLEIFRSHYGTFWLLERQGFVKYFSWPNIITRKRTKTLRYPYYQCYEMGWYNSNLKRENYPFL